MTRRPFRTRSKPESKPDSGFESRNQNFRFPFSAGGPLLPLLALAASGFRCFLIFPQFSPFFAFFHHFPSFVFIFPHFRFRFPVSGFGWGSPAAAPCLGGFRFPVFPQFSPCFLNFHHFSTFFHIFLIFHHFSSFVFIFPHFPHFGVLLEASWELWVWLADKPATTDGVPANVQESDKPYSSD